MVVARVNLTIVALAMAVALTRVIFIIGALALEMTMVVARVNLTIVALAVAFILALFLVVAVALPLAMALAVALGLLMAIEIEQVMGNNYCDNKDALIVFKIQN
jgi:hypothetical protein